MKQYVQRLCSVVHLDVEFQYVLQFAWCWYISQVILARRQRSDLCSLSSCHLQLVYE